MMNPQNDKQNFYAWALFILWPLLAVVSAFRNYRQPWAKNIFWAFCAFYGFVFAIGAESQGSDIVRYVAHYQGLYGVELTVASTITEFQQSTEADIMRTLIAVVLSRLSDSQALLTLVYGIIFGFFFSRNLWYIMERLEGKILPITLLLLTCFFLVNPIWRLNGFRMWTAMHVFLYGLLPFLLEGKRKGLFISALSILVHFSFILPVLTLLAYLVAGNRLTVYFAFFLVTIFISEINIETFNHVVETYAPESFQERSSSYRDADRVEEYREADISEDRRWYAVWYGRALKYSLFGFLIVLFIQGRPFFEKNKNWLSLFCFTLVLFGVANLMSSIPSGGRFLSVANFCALALVTMYVQNQPREKMMKRVILLSTPALLLFVIVALRIGLYSMSATAIFGNPLLAFFIMGDHISLNDVMKMIL